MMGTQNPYQILMEMSAQASRATPMCSQYVWGDVMCPAEEWAIYKENTWDKTQKLLKVIPTAILTMALGVRIVVYLKGEQMAVTVKCHGQQYSWVRTEL